MKKLTIPAPTPHGQVANFFSQPSTADNVNLFNLERSKWLIDGVAVTATAAQLNSAGGGFNYENMLFVAKGGSDLNPGDNPTAPKLTIQAAINTAGSPLQPTVIYVLDAGIYLENLTITQGDIFIYAPTAFISSGSGVTLTINAPGKVGIGVIAGFLTSFDNTVFIQDVNACYINAVNLAGGTIVNNAGNNIIICDVYTADVITVNGGNLRLQFKDCQDPISLIDNTNNTIDNLSGFMGELYLGTNLKSSSQTITYQSGDYTLGLEDLGTTIIANGPGAQTFTLPQDSTLHFPDGATFTIKNNAGGTVSFTTEGSDVIVGNLNTMTEVGGSVNILKEVTTLGISIWWVNGDVEFVGP